MCNHSPRCDSVFTLFTCCSVNLSLVWELRSSPLMFYLYFLQPPVSPPPFFFFFFYPPLPYLPSLSRQKRTQRSCRAADWLSWRLSKCVRVCVCVTFNNGSRIWAREAYSIMSQCCWRQNDQVIQVEFMFMQSVFACCYETTWVLLSPGRYEQCPSVSPLFYKEHDFMYSA